MLEKLKRQCALVLMCALGLTWLVAGGIVANAASPGDVVINEVAWAGTLDSSSDEWIELYNPTSAAIDLSGWSIEDSGSAYPALKSGQIQPHGYFLIEDSEATTSAQSDSLINMSLLNSGASLILKDASGAIVDKVNSGGGTWYAGNSSEKATMERVDPVNHDDVAANWATAVSGNGAKGKSGKNILGTPRSTNSKFGGSGVEISFDQEKLNASLGSSLTVPVYVKNVSDLYAYGFEINYPAGLLSFVSAKESDFLTNDGMKTAFNAALKNGQEGTLLVGNARLVNQAKGVDGGGELMELNFKVIAPTNDTAQVSFGGSSFIADSKADLAAKFRGLEVDIGQKLAENQPVTVGAISGGKVDFGDKRFSLKISWQQDVVGADSYIVKRKNQKGEYVTLGEVKTAYFADDDSLTNGGKLIPGVKYFYAVIPVKSGVQGKIVEIGGSETRGIKGDSDRNDVVDGRDIENLARTFGSVAADGGYNSLTDTNYDGLVDGQDLIDIGANFGLSY